MKHRNLLPVALSALIIMASCSKEVELKNKLEEKTTAPNKYRFDEILQLHPE